MRTGILLIAERKEDQIPIRVKSTPGIGWCHPGRYLEGMATRLPHSISSRDRAYDSPR